jgi:hypothetical protein
MTHEIRTFRQTHKCGGSNKVDFNKDSFYSRFGLDNELYNQFNNQTNSADDYIDCKITGSDVKLPVLHFFTKQNY